MEVAEGIIELDWCSLDPWFENLVSITQAGQELVKIIYDIVYSLTIYPILKSLL